MHGVGQARRANASGFTLIELVVSAALLAVLAAAAMPMFEVSVRREREIELRQSLRQMRRAIDDFHKSYIASGGSVNLGPTAGGPGQVGAAQPGQGQPGFPGQPSFPGQPGGASGPKGPGFANAAAGQEVPLIDVSEFDPIDSKGYPPTLKILVEGVQAMGGGTEAEDRVKFLRRIPLDPMISHANVDASDANFGWGVRSYQDAPSSRVWGRQNVYDVYTKGSGTALDGSKYQDW